MLEKQLLKKFISQWRCWNLDISDTPTILKKLDKGLTNDSWLIKSDKNLYVLRINKKSDLWETNRSNENKIQGLAHSLGLAAQVIYNSPKYEYRITEYLREKENIKKDCLTEREISSLLNGVNQLKKININLPYMNYSDQLFHYWGIYTSNIKPSTVEIEEFKKSIQQCNNYEKNFGKELSICHHDLNKDNVIFESSSRDSVKFLDWEFCRIGIKSFDFASLVCEFNFDFKNIKKFIRIDEAELKEAIKTYQSICKYYILALKS